MELLRFSDPPRKYSFEISVAEKDSKGKPTGQQKTFASDSAAAIASFYYRYSHDNRKRKGGKTPTKDEAAKILKEIFPAEKETE